MGFKTIFDQKKLLKDYKSASNVAELEKKQLETEKEVMSNIDIHDDNQFYLADCLSYRNMEKLQEAAQALLENITNDIAAFSKTIHERHGKEATTDVTKCYCGRLKYHAGLTCDKCTAWAKMHK